MINLIKSNSLIKSIFIEPNTSKYKVPNDLAIKIDLEWISPKTDYKNLNSDFKKIKSDLKLAVSEYTENHNG